MTEQDSAPAEPQPAAPASGHDVAPEGPRSDLAAADDYIGFCDGLRQICGIDLTQYKRPQMERRLRSYWERTCLDAHRRAAPFAQ